MPWWGWIVVGAALLGAEMAVPADFYLAVLGVAALAMGLFGAIGLEGPVYFQWLLFAALAIAALVLARRRLADRFGAGRAAIVDDLVGEVAVATEPIAPGSTGRVELRGSAFRAHNDGDAALAAGDRARVERVEGLLLHLRREG
jgi:membrane protein implicated in regulation of membrane protease activity